MTTLSHTLNMDQVAQADEVLGRWGVSPFLVKTVHEWDFDPEPLYDLLDSLQQTVAQVRAGIGPLLQPVNVPGCWEGPAAGQAEKYRKCVATWWQQILDFLLGLIDWLVQLIDYVLDALHWVASWIAWIASTIELWIAAVGLVLLTKLPLSAPVMVFLGKVMLFVGALALTAGVIAMATWLINVPIEWLQELIRKGRDSLCGGGIIPRTKDWDPVPHLPSWPF